MSNTYLLAYGSLLSKFSREVHSGITGEAVPATVHGWSRAWCAADLDEAATYAGAQPNPNAILDAVLIPTELDPALQQRERNYRFTPVPKADLVFSSSISESAIQGQIVICEILAPQAATKTNPLPQSYVDTCLIGCFEAGGTQAVARFIEHTTGWDSYWLNDRQRQTLIYPRHARLSKQQHHMLDGILAECGVLSYRLQD